MAVNINAASASTFTAVVEAKSSSAAPLSHRHTNVSYALSPNPKLRFLSKGTSGIGCNVKAKAQLNKVDVDNSLDSAVISSLDSKSGAPAKGTQNENSESKTTPVDLASEESVSQFISQVANLVKLVDSRDIVELQMKQLDCEILIRKKEAITPSIHPVAFNVMQQPPPQHLVAPQAAAPAPAPLTSSPASAPSAPKPAKSSVPPLKSPMAGTFYRSPAPGAPPFVKVGDKVQKGQVLCIVEAMKLMNEIEADQSGTLLEVVAEDGKPVSLDTPLFVIQP